MLKRNISVLALVIAIAVSLYFFYAYKDAMEVSTEPFPMDWSINIPSDDTSFSGVFANFHFDDSLPHYLYRRLEDSFKSIQQDRDYENKSFPLSSQSNGVWGVAKLRKTKHLPLSVNLEADTLSKRLMDEMKRFALLSEATKNADSMAFYRKMEGDLNFKINIRMNELNRQRIDSEEKDGLDYFTLAGYELDDDSKFFVQNGTYNIAWAKWDSTIKRTADSTKIGHYERKQIPSRYIADEKQLMIPVSKGPYNFLNSILNIWRFLKLFLAVYFIIGLPIQILIDISTGHAFTEKNIRRFKIMAFILLSYALLDIAAPFILKLVFHKWIPGDFTGPSLRWILWGNAYNIGLAVALFIVGKAFQRGLKLQKEQDLTI